MIATADLTTQGRDERARTNSGRAASFRSFVRTLRTYPRQVGTVAPSGNELAKLITREVDARANRVVELGPGTGVFTRKLLDQGIEPQNLSLVEINPVFAADLSERFPRCSIFHVDAARIDRAPRIEVGSVDAIVSGLPLLNFTPRAVTRDRVAAKAVMLPLHPLHLWRYHRMGEMLRAFSNDRELDEGDRRSLLEELQRPE